MPNIPIDCPYCNKPITSTFFLKHIFASHFDTLFDAQDQKGKQNRLLIESSRSPKPIAFYMPGSQDNHCCLHCMVSCVKFSSAQKHFESDECKVGHMQKLKEIHEQLESKGNEQSPKEPSISLEDNPLFLCALYQFQRTVDALEAENKKIQNTLNHLIEEGVDIHRWDEEDISIDEEEDDPTRILDFVARAMKWKITRCQLETAFKRTKPNLLSLTRRQPKKTAPIEKTEEATQT